MPQQSQPIDIIAGQRENVPGGDLFRVPVTSPPSPAGLATLVAGAATVQVSRLTNTSRIFLSRQAAGGTLGHLSIVNVMPGKSFGILSSSNTETSSVAWIIE